MSNVKLSPSQASKLFGVSERSVRRGIKSKELPATVHNGRYKIDFQDLLLWSEKLPNRQLKRDEFGLGQFVEKWKL